MNQSQLKKKYGFEFPFKPDPLVRRARRHIRKPGRLLDLGAGEGADSVFFGERGFKVTAIDRNREYLRRLRAIVSDRKLDSIEVRHRDARHFRFPRNAFDVISCILVICCMRRSEFEKMLAGLKKSVRPGGIVVMSARNYLDPEMNDYVSTERMIEPNTFRSKEDCCKFIYFIEKHRLREVFRDFDTLYYYEGFAPCKYKQHPRHGDSYIIARRKVTA